MSAAAPPIEGVPAVALDELLRSMADDEFVIGFSDSEWTGIAPLLEEDVAMSSLAQDELGHAQALYALLADFTGTNGDAIAYEREPEAYRHCRLLDHGRGDWAMTIARRYLYDTADAVRLDALAYGHWKPLGELVAKLQREERYHRMHATAWFERLARGGADPRARLVAALDELADDAATVFSPLAGEAVLVDAGILGAPMAELETRWRGALAPVFGALDLPMPPAAHNPKRGRLDHGEAFGWLHGEFTMVRRSDPGATW
jgi:ring-1,2-phenylacetyl-CoA epoxidase subunit PaaC